MASRVITAILLVTVAGCSGGDSPSGPDSQARSLTRVEVSPAAATLEYVGDTMRVVAYGLDGEGVHLSGIQFTWSSTAPEIAIVDQSGLVTAVSDGTTSVVASSDGISGSASLSVRIVPATVEFQIDSLEFTALGDTINPAFFVRDSGGTPISGAATTLNSYDPGVAGVTADGDVVSTGAGETWIEGRIDGLVDSLFVRVQQVPATVELNVSNVDLFGLGSTSSITAKVVDSNGNMLPGGSQPDVSSSNEDVVSISGEEIVAEGLGVADLVAEFEGLASSAVQVRVDGWRKIFDGYDRLCGVTALSGVYCSTLGRTDAEWNPLDQTSDVPEVLQVSIGNHHVCVLIAGGALRCSGSNEKGQLGGESHGTTYVSPMPDHVVTQVTAFGKSTCALTEAQELFCWGDNFVGQLGLGDLVDRETPQSVGSGYQSLPRNSYQIADISPMMCAATVGAVRCWGQFPNNQIQATPTDVIEIDAPGSISLYYLVPMRVADGQVSLLMNDGWGTPVVELSAFDDITYVSGADNGTGCALRRNGDIICWGSDLYGERGITDPSELGAPVNTVGGGHEWSALARKSGTTCGLDSLSRLYCWGWGFGRVPTRVAPPR